MHSVPIVDEQAIECHKIETGGTRDEGLLKNKGSLRNVRLV
jgi:hypothetical protein